MGTPLRVSIPHQLGRAEARRRIDTGFAKLAQQLPGGASIGNPSWHDDRLAFSVAALGQAVSGSIEVLDTAVMIDIELPGLLGQLAAGFKDRLREAGQKLLAKD